MQVQPRYVSTLDSFGRLWLHESMRSFYDRLINEDDRGQFRDMVIDLGRRLLNISWQPEEVFGDNPIIFCDFLNPTAEAGFVFPVLL